MNLRVTLAIGLSCLSAGAAFGRFPHGSAPTFSGDTWLEALEKVPCPNVARVGKDLQITGIVEVKGEKFPNPLVTEKDRIEPVEKRCDIKR